MAPLIFLVSSVMNYMNLENYSLNCEKVDYFTSLDITVGHLTFLS